jgi:hypothetical protein
MHAHKQLSEALSGQSTYLPQQAVDADGRLSELPEPFPPRPWWTTTGSFVATCYLRVSDAVAA